MAIIRHKNSILKHGLLLKRHGHHSTFRWRGGPMEVVEGVYTRLSANTWLVLFPLGCEPLDSTGHL